MADVTASQAKLIQYLNEAYGTERRLETALTAHIQLAARAPYKKRLQQHLTETKRHAREVSRRIKQLGGVAEEVDLPGPDAVSNVVQGAVGLAQRGAALAQGPLHALRGTGAAEKQLKNVKTEYQSEAEEIATYSAIETFAEAVNDRDTAKLAKAIRREEERMLAFLEKEIGRLTGLVVREEIPASERRRSTGRRSTSTRRASSSRAASTRSSSSRSSSRGSSSRGSSSRGGSSRSSSSRSGSSSRGSSSRASSSRSGSSRGSSARSGSSRSTSARSGSSRGTSARSGTSRGTSSRSASSRSGSTARSGSSRSGSSARGSRARSSS